MRKLIKGDITRILHKKEIYVFFLILVIILFAMGNKSTPEDQISSFQTMSGMVGLFLCLIPVYLTVYGDEMRAGSMQIVLGRGMSRRKVVASKVIDCFILFTMMFMGLLVMFYIKNAIGHVTLTSRQNLMIFVEMLNKCIESAAYFALAGLFLFSSWNVAIGLTGLIVLVMLNVALGVIQMNTHIPLRDYWISGLSQSAFQDINVGNFPWGLVGLIAVYIVGAIIVTAKIFERKEIDL